jgi:CheY-like chemotaxis protein
MITRSSTDPLRILLVADDEASGSSVAARLGAEFGAGLRTCVRPEEGPAQVQAYRPDVVVLALASLEAAERYAPALLGAGSGASARPFVIALCNAASSGAAARLCRRGLIDDYVQHFPMPADPARLATSIHLAARIAAPARVAAYAGAAAPQRRPIVLVVEDDEVQHTLVAAMLESERIDLVFEADGGAAIERIRAVGPDLVLMDFVLPGDDGVALTEQIKAAPDLAAIPVVMVTGEARLDTLVRSMEAGAADFIVKPFTREALIAKLTKYLPATP